MKKKGDTYLNLRLLSKKDVVKSYSGEVCSQVSDRPNGEANTERGFENIMHFILNGWYESKRHSRRYEK